MTNEQIVKLLVASGAVRVQGDKVTVDLPKVTGHWTNDGRHGWRRDLADGDGGGRHEGQDSGD